MKAPIAQVYKAKTSSFLNSRCAEITKAWEKAATDISIESGVFVSVECDNDAITWEIYFVVKEHKFGSLYELRTAINNKAFL